VPVELKIKLAVAGTTTTITVESAGADLLENVPYAHNDVDTKTQDKLPISSPGSGMSDAIMISSGAVAADSNGMPTGNAVSRIGMGPIDHVAPFSVDASTTLVGLRGSIGSVV